LRWNSAFPCAVNLGNKLRSKAVLSHMGYHVARPQKWTGKNAGPTWKRHSAATS
jgi:hypothetical protein